MPWLPMLRLPETLFGKGMTMSDDQSPGGPRSEGHTCFVVAVAWARNPKLDAVNMRDI